MNDLELNETLGTLADVDTDSVQSPMAFHGKVLPYRGWYWRDIYDWTRIPVSQCDGIVLFDVAGKWLEPRWYLDGAQSKAVRLMAEAFAKEPTALRVSALCEWLNGLSPPADAVEESEEITERYREITRRDPNISWSP